jgi:hypothetical protein
MGITYPSSHPVNSFYHAGPAKNHAEWWLWLCFLGLDHNKRSEGGCRDALWCKSHSNHHRRTATNRHQSWQVRLLDRIARLQSQVGHFTVDKRKVMAPAGLDHSFQTAIERPAIHEEPRSCRQILRRSTDENRLVPGGESNRQSGAFTVGLH